MRIKGLTSYSTHCMTPSETPRYDADRPRYNPLIPSVRSISHVIVIAGGRTRAGFTGKVAVLADEAAASDAAEAAMGPGRGERGGAVGVSVGIAVGLGLRPACNCNRVFTTRVYKLSPHRVNMSITHPIWDLLPFPS
jgi:hypothetical protein